MTNKKINYINKYNKQNYKMYQFRVKKEEKEIIKKLDEIENRNKYIRDLILEDINPSILTIKQIRTRIKSVIEKHHIEEVYLFGSYSRGEATKDSDVDLYMSSGDCAGLLDLVELEKELEESLCKKVDVITIGSQMHWFFKQQLEEDKIRIW